MNKKRSDHRCVVDFYLKGFITKMPFQTQGNIIRVGHLQQFQIRIKKNLKKKKSHFLPFICFDRFNI